MKKLYLIISIFILLFNLASAEWEECSNGISDLKILSLVKDGNRVYAGGMGGLYMSENFGANLSNLNLPISSVNRVFGIYPRGDTIIISSTSGIFISFNIGKKWLIKNRGLEPLVETNDTIVISVTSYKNKLLAGTCNGVYISSDYGETWSALNKGIEKVIIKCFYFQGDTILAGAQTDDNGTGGGLYISTDAGNSWSYLDFINYSVRSIVKVGGWIYCGITDLGVHYTEDAGKSWKIKNHGLYPLAVTQLARFNEIFFCSVWYGGVFASTDFGENWIKMNNGLKDKSVRSIVQCGDYLIAGTYWGGIYRIKLIDFINLLSVEKEDKDELILYPNPAEYSINLPSGLEFDKYIIYDLKGSVCQTGIISGYSINIDKLPAGVYFLNTSDKRQNLFRCFVKN